MTVPPALAEIQSTVDRAVREQGPAVVGVGRGWRVGSGIVIAPGRVLTAAHRAGEGVAVTFDDGREESGEPVAVDRDLDLAVLAVETAEVDPPEWAPDEAAAAGAPVVAMGNPGGRGLRATLGFVAAASRSFRGPRGRRVSGALEHTAPLPRGSAGGPLLDAEGRLLGVNLLRLDGGLIIALGVAGGLRSAVDRLARGEAPARPRLGVAVAPARAARRMRHAVGLPERDGVLVRGVEEGSPAARAGIAQGDLIVAASGRAVEGVDSLHRALDESSGNGGFALTVVRGTEEREVDIDLAGGPS
jgi:serine protease Do